MSKAKVRVVSVLLVLLVAGIVAVYSVCRCRFAPCLEVVVKNGTNVSLVNVAVFAHDAKSALVHHIDAGGQVDVHLSPQDDSALVVVFACDDEYRYIDCGYVSPSPKQRRTVEVSNQGKSASLSFGENTHVFESKPLEDLRNTSGGLQLASWYAPASELFKGE